MFDLLIILLAVVVLFILNVLASCFALGRMHVWLKDKREVFGDGEGLRASIRSDNISNHNSKILDRNNGT